MEATLTMDCSRQKTPVTRISCTRKPQRRVRGNGDRVSSSVPRVLCFVGRLDSHDDYQCVPTSASWFLGGASGLVTARPGPPLVPCLVTLRVCHFHVAFHLRGTRCRFPSLYAAAFQLETVEGLKRPRSKVEDQNEKKVHRFKSKGDVFAASCALVVESRFAPQPGQRGVDASRKKMQGGSRSLGGRGLRGKSRVFPADDPGE